ncbi:MAG: PEP-CTERM sorting domain-containing protein, partial [bacterium]|nr:PEP-CTERM sorting domain-containing protein [bacterium]
MSTIPEPSTLVGLAGMGILAQVPQLMACEPCFSGVDG